MQVSEVARFWDEAVAAFLAGGPCVPPEIRQWRAAYQGSGAGAVDERALLEPFGGSLSDSPMAVFLNLNPGAANLQFQGRDGVFAREIREFGSYSRWAATLPYLRAPWETTMGPNRHGATRLSFLRRWFGEPSLTASVMPSFELFPWHSARVTAAMRPDPAIIREFVWEPIADLGVPVVFAFGAPWFPLLPKLGVREVARLGRGGKAYGSSVPSRSVFVGRTAEGIRVVAEKHSGSASPPSEPETMRLRQAVEALGA